MHGWSRAWAAMHLGVAGRRGPHAPLSHRTVTWIPDASETLPTRAHGRWGPHAVEGLCPPRGDEPGAWGSPGPDILFLHESCLPPRHHPLPETRVSPRPLVWLSHSPPGHAGCMAKGDNMRLCCRSAGHDPGATTGNAGGRRNQGTGTPPPRGGRRPARPRHAPAPTPASASQRHFCSSPRLDPDTRKKKKKKIPVL